ncbi:MAG: hypothetical protein LBH49_00510 [Puniceicoccales bacterium]|nr:hypothetical protein [Puniceicoccales bacterium]
MKKMKLLAMVLYVMAGFGVQILQCNGAQKLNGGFEAKKKFSEKKFNLFPGYKFGKINNKWRRRMVRYEIKRQAKEIHSFIKNQKQFSCNQRKNLHNKISRYFSQIKHNINGKKSYG